MENIIEEYSKLQTRIAKMSNDPRIELWIKYLEAGGEASAETIQEVNANLRILSAVILEEAGDLQTCVDLFNKKSQSTKLQILDGDVQYLVGCACCAQPARVIEAIEFS